MTPHEKKRLKKLDKLTDKALRDVNKTKNAKKDVIADWYKYVEILSKYIKNKLIH